MKTRVPETIACVNCNHNIVIKLYEVDTTINSSQGHFHTVYNPAEPAYTVYCINCGHFMTNDPNHVPPQAVLKARLARRAPSKRTSAGADRLRKPLAQKKSAKRSKDKRTAKTQAPAARKKQVTTKSKTAKAAAKPRRQTGKPATQARSSKRASKKVATPKQQRRPQRKKAK